MSVFFHAEYVDMTKEPYRSILKLLEPLEDKTSGFLGYTLEELYEKLWPHQPDIIHSAVVALVNEELVGCKEVSKGVIFFLEPKGIRWMQENLE